jgi:hypothetical protein
MILPLGVAGTIWGILRLREPVAFPLIGAAYVYALFVLAVLSLAAFSLRGRHEQRASGGLQVRHAPGVPGQFRFHIGCGGHFRSAAGA